MKSNVLACALGILLVGVGGCNPSPGSRAQDPAEAKAALLAQWHRLADGMAEKVDAPRGRAIALELSQIEPQGYEPILEILEDREAPENERLLAFLSLEGAPGVPTEADFIVPRLLEMGARKNDPMGSSCALELLLVADHPDAEKAFRTYAREGSGKTKLNGLIWLLRRGAEEAHGELAKMFDDPGTTQEERDRIVFEVAQRALESDGPLLEKALVQGTEQDSTRAQAAMALGRIGTAAQIPALELCLQAEGISPELKAVLQSSLEILQKRAGSNEQTGETPAAE